MEDKKVGSPHRSPLSGVELRQREQFVSQDVRYRALELAVQTIRNVQGFSDAQIIRTADRYTKFITTGEVPQPVEPTPPDPRGDTDGDV